MILSRGIAGLESLFGPISYKSVSDMYGLPSTATEFFTNTTKIFMLGMIWMSLVFLIDQN